MKYFLFLQMIVLVGVALVYVIFMLRGTTTTITTLGSGFSDDLAGKAIIIRGTEGKESSYEIVKADDTTLTVKQHPIDKLFDCWCNYEMKTGTGHYQIRELGESVDTRGFRFYRRIYVATCMLWWRFKKYVWEDKEEDYVIKGYNGARDDRD